MNLPPRPVRSAILLTTVLGASAAPACCGVGTASVAFTGQRDLVIWDAERGIEHFVREASFDSKGDLGFLAPTPNVPTLAESSPAAFSILEEAVDHHEYPDAAAAHASEDVEVVRREHVAGYDAAVLKAGDARALRGWLGRNGFPAPRWMETWVAPYLKNHWSITAFRVLRGDTPRPVRMTFRTETPFAPYAVPKENNTPGARLQLFLVSSASLQARVGDRDWKARSSGEVPIDESTRERLATAIGLKPADLPASATVRRYVDDRFGTEAMHDLTFEPARESRLVPYGLGGGTFVALFALLARRRRARTRAQVSGA